MWLSRLSLLSHDLHTSVLASQFPVVCRCTLNAIAAVFAEGSQVKEVVSLTGDCVYSVLKLCIGILMNNRRDCNKSSMKMNTKNKRLNNNDDDDDEVRKAERVCCHHILIQ